MAEVSSSNLTHISNTNSNMNGILADIIKLQLKKPKHWNWELTTSRSLPHISLPIIQLYDAKGKLLAQTNDEKGSGTNIVIRDGGIVEQRRSWCSDNVVGDIRNGLEKSYSEKNLGGNKVNEHQKGCSSTTSRAQYNLHKSSSQNDTTANVQDWDINRGGKLFRTIEQQQRQHPNNDTIARIQSLRERIGHGEIASSTKYRRSRSDDLSKRHKQLVTIVNDKPDPIERLHHHHHHHRHKQYTITEENVSDDKNLLDIKTAVKQAARYEARTSTAGTLIIRIDSIDENEEAKRRRRKTAPDHLQEQGKRFVRFAERPGVPDIRRSRTVDFDVDRKQVPHEIRRRKTNEMEGVVVNYEQCDKERSIKGILDKIKQRLPYSRTGSMEDQHDMENDVERLQRDTFHKHTKIPLTNDSEIKYLDLRTNGITNVYNNIDNIDFDNNALFKAQVDNRIKQSNVEMLNKELTKYEEPRKSDGTLCRKLIQTEDCHYKDNSLINSNKHTSQRKTHDFNPKHHNNNDYSYHRQYKCNNSDSNKALPIITPSNDVVKRSQSERGDASRIPGLFHSLSDVLQRDRLLEAPLQGQPSPLRRWRKLRSPKLARDANSNYLRQEDEDEEEEQEVVEDSSDSDRLDDIRRLRTEARMRRRYQRYRRLYADDRRCRGWIVDDREVLHGGEEEAEGSSDDGHTLDARIVKDHRRSSALTTTTPQVALNPSPSAPTPTREDLVHLVVQHLTNASNQQQHVSAPPPAEASMGANVSSRHNSNKRGDGGASGLSAGRRSQSSGSIYSRQRRGSGRVVDKGDGGSEKGCGSGSLPGYFDLTGDIGNDDQDGEDHDNDAGDRSSLDEANSNLGNRIPSLGDASGGGGGGAPLHWKFSDGPAPSPFAAVGSCRLNGGLVGHHPHHAHHHHHHQVLFCDQGYGSERSPEEEFPPPLLASGGGDTGEAVYHQLELHSCYPFITPESTFSVSLAKGSRGLGLSVTGGIDSGGSWPGLIRVKRLFPHQPAAASGCLGIGDLILEANGIPLTGLTNYEALEVLRTAPAQVELRVCRPPPDVLNCVSPISEVPPPPPTRSDPPPSSLNLSAGITSDDDYHGEFEITMRKMQGSLGFTLRKEDDSALGHYIRALVREPALKDGRIRPGDKIIAVNDKEISEMSHEEAVQFLRHCGDLVKLRLYRDAAQTPIATLSPTETTPRTSFCRKAQLRQEAVDMLNDIAVRKLIPNQQQPQSSDSHRSTGGSPTTSPRRLRRALTSDSSSTNSVKTYTTLAEEQFHEALLHDGVYHSGHIPLDEESFNSLFIQEDDDDPDRPNRPASLDLYNPNQTPVAARKPKFNFSLAHNAYELNNLDAEILDAPNLTYNMNEDLRNAEMESTDGGYPHEPASMPHIRTESSTFSYKNPAYQTAHPTCTVSGPAAVPVSANENAQVLVVDGSSGTLPSRWAGGKLSGGDTKRHHQEREAITAPLVSGEDSEVESGTIRRRRKPILKESKPLAEEEPKILAIELNRGWNSRLGFSLQGAAGVTYVSAVHADSVAARDGRIKPGDRVIKVNDENVDHLSTNEIIDLLRIVRGPVCIVVSRGKAAVVAAAAAVTEDCLKSNAVN